MGQGTETEAGIIALLEEGTRRHLSGDVKTAARLYQQVLASQPENTDALNLLGVASLQCDMPDRAVQLLRKAVSLDASNPGCLNNLGQALVATGEIDDAIECYRTALEIEPNDPRCLNNIGLALHQKGQYDEALATASRARSIDPNNPEIHHNIGVIFQEIGRLNEAVDAYRRAIQLKPGSTSTYASLASALTECGEPEMAIQCCLEAVDIDPLCVEVHDVYRKLVWDIGELDRMDHSYLRACERLPNSSEVFANFGEALITSKNRQQGTAALERAVALDPENATALSQLGRAFTQAGKYDEALGMHLQAILIDETNASFYEELGDTYAHSGNFNEAAGAYCDAHERNPRRSKTLGSLTIALNEIGDSSVHDLVDYETYVTSRIIDVPEGFGSIEAFNHALHEELAARHVERPHPIGQTMRGGTQIRGHLFRAPTGLVRVARDQIAKPLARYIESLEDDPAHPFLRYANRKFKFTGAWSTILSESGYDGSHIHNDGWLSGTYYVKVPEVDEQCWAAGEGCIQFGEPPPPFPSERNRTQRLIRPQPGLAVFFPSYYWHGVRPFRQKGQRHAISFDVI